MESQRVSKNSFDPNIINIILWNNYLVQLFKNQCTSDQSLEKMLYLASENITKKWTQRYRGWDQVLNQLIVLYGERLTQHL